MPRLLAPSLLVLALLAGAPAASAAPCAAPGPAARTAQDRPTVSATVDAAVAGGRVAAADGEAWKATYRRAREVAATLTGLRRAELRGATALLERAVLRRELTPARMPGAFLALQRNVEHWPAAPLPEAPRPPAGRGPCTGGAGLGGARVTFPGDPVVFQWYRGQGLQVLPLASFGRANALWTACTRADAGTCRPEELRGLLERLLALAVERRGFLAWEHGFAFGGGAPFWVSAIAQGTAVQALVRGAALLGEPRFLEAARAAAGAFAVGAPAGVRARSTAGRGDHFLLYSFAPGLRVLNAFGQALVGLHELAATGDARAGALLARGRRGLAAELAGYDTGAWSRYALGGAEADLGYHRLSRDVLRGLCERVGDAAACAGAERFTRYLGERARVRLAVAGRPRAGRPAALRVVLSKRACLTLRVRRAGAVVLERTVVLGRGTHALAWRPARAGRHEVEVRARDLMNHHTVVTRTVRVRG